MGVPHPQISLPGPQTRPTLQVLTPHSVSGFLCPLPSVAVDGECSQKTVRGLWTREKLKLKIQHHFWKTRERFPVAGPVNRRNQRRHKILRILPREGARRGAPTQRQRKPHITRAPVKRKACLKATSDKLKTESATSNVKVATKSLQRT